MSKSYVIIITIKIFTYLITSFSFGQYRDLESNIANDLFDVCFYDSLTGWAVGDSATIIRTNDGGMTWTRQLNPVDSTIFTKVEFINKNLGFVGGNRILPNPNKRIEFPVLLKTTDGGNTWEECDLGLGPRSEDTDISFSDMDYLDSNMGWVSINESHNRTGMLIRTEDAGENWELIKEISGNHIFTTKIWDKKTGYIIYGPAFDNFNFCVGVYTEDSGYSWVSTARSLSFYMNEMEFISPDTLWATGQSTYKSYDRGINWIYIEPTLKDQNFYPRDIHIFNSQNVWLVGYVREKTNLSDYSAVLMTTRNAGENWKVNLEIPQKYFNACDIVSSQCICIVGDNGLIILADLAEISSVKNLPINPAGFELKQNYPNPFNPKTNIKYQIPKSEHVKLFIYDVLGKKIATLVDQKQARGIYNVEWDAKGFSSGIYLYRFETKSGITKSRKLLLLK